MYQKNTKIDAPVVAHQIVEWLKNYALNAHQNGFVVGVSGGIDSAVTSTLCAMTGLKTLCVQMPIHQSNSEINRAQEHVLQLANRFYQVEHINLNLTNTFEVFKETMPIHQDQNTYLLSLANTRSRLRMTTLYYLAGIHKLLVAGTGNKVEDFGIGFYTKYGDGGVDISPIADLMKSEVYSLGAYLQVPQSILEAAPTDGLFGDTRTDEDQIGANYDELEWAMEQQALGKDLSDFSGRDLEVYKIYLKFNQANQHKMKPIPVFEVKK